MALLTDLPTEILELIYHFLGSIDDVHHLGRTCKALGHVTRRQRVYLEIMRSVIYCSPQHRHDYQLCMILYLHTLVVNHVTRYRTRLPIAIRPATQPNLWENRLLSALRPDPSRTAFSDRVICDILARYQGLRVLQDIWLERQLGRIDYLSAGDFLNDAQLYDRFGTLVSRDDEFRDGCIPKRCSHTVHTRFYTSLNPGQRARFHAAVVRVWLLNEIRWVLTNFAYPVTDFTNQILVLERCKQLMKSGQHAPLMDRLDEFAVFTFMYHHLLPRHMMLLADRDSSKLPFTFESEFGRDTAQWSSLFRLCLMAGQVYFQPPDLIDLMVRSRLSRKPPYPGTEMPESSEKWRHPLPTRAPQGVKLCEDYTKLLISHITYHHLRVMARSSFHQHRRDVSPSMSPISTILFDHARKYFACQAVSEFEKDLSRQPGLKDAGVTLRMNWAEMQWEIWWWAHSDDKARMKMERWRRGGEGEA